MLVNPANTIDGQFLDSKFLDIKHVVLTTVAIIKLDTANTIDFLQMILSELRSYFFVGGMPESVKTWRDSGSMVETFQVQSEILESYRDDFSKYKPRIDTACLDAVFLNTAKSVGEQLKYIRSRSNQAREAVYEVFT